jgi:cellulose synthase/poly-beta-1,6-N-acetylglucosamine synthase-like glycosyltransferase
VTLLREDTILTSYAARNCGIANARGEVVAFVDCDCEASPHWLEHLMEPFEDASVGAVTGPILDSPPESLAEEFTARISPFATPARGVLKTLLTANAAVRASALRAVGSFDERLPTGGDVDLGWRLQQQLGLQLLEASEACVRHRHRRTFAGVFSQFQRYGLSEIILTTVYHGAAGSPSESEQLARLLRQAIAMVSYVASFCLRAVKSISSGVDRRYVLWPVFLLVAESANVFGKLRGLIASRYYRRNPYANPRIFRSA